MSRSFNGLLFERLVFALYAIFLFRLDVFDKDRPNIQAGIESILCRLRFEHTETGGAVIDLQRSVSHLLKGELVETAEQLEHGKVLDRFTTFQMQAEERTEDFCDFIVGSVGRVRIH